MFIVSTQAVDTLIHMCDCQEKRLSGGMWSSVETAQIEENNTAVDLVINSQGSSSVQCEAFGDCSSPGGRKREREEREKEG